MKRASFIAFVITMMPHLVWAQDSLASQEKSIPGGTLALAAYLVLWFMLLAYFVVLTTRLRKMRQDVKTLEKRVDELFEQ